MGRDKEPPKATQQAATTAPQRTKHQARRGKQPAQDTGQKGQTRKAARNQGVQQGHHLPTHAETPTRGGTPRSNSAPTTRKHNTKASWRQQQDGHCLPAGLQHNKAAQNNEGATQKRKTRHTTNEKERTRREGHTRCALTHEQACRKKRGRTWNNAQGSVNRKRDSTLGQTASKEEDADKSRRKRRQRTNKDKATKIKRHTPIDRHTAIGRARRKEGQRIKDSEDKQRRTRKSTAQTARKETSTKRATSWQEGRREQVARQHRNTTASTAKNSTVHGGRQPNFLRKTGTKPSRTTRRKKHRSRRKTGERRQGKQKEKTRGTSTGKGGR
ncbi:hypothetical protein, conserved in T. vivax [Trypanosoma vivax Y486]|uniref:Uncharacterized protein n=1 Tax=Trypanosoma vivax (strain Y486) TaxID=1055687 RepID=F9WUU4_TRYVY|nr:hypothetical protein, conserved in T. vivax [Trypanosoma vivax Y486]|eukprot:CCD21343.1 hypothetical protein, conserved in T. vivax [Trypanosoma vivax Y486]